MHLAGIFYLLIAAVYVIAGLGAGRHRQHETAIHDLQLALLHVSVALVDLPLIDLALLLPDLARFLPLGLA